MALETFLVVLREDSSSRDVNRVISAIGHLGGNVEITARRGNVLVASFDPALAESMRRLPSVKLVGGVSVGQRKLERRRESRQPPH